MSLHDAIARFELAGFLPHYLIEAHGDRQIHVFEENVEYENLLADELAHGEFCGALFRRNLTVTNFLHQAEMDYGPLLIVEGNVAAKNIFVSGGDIFFRGCVDVEQTFIAGVYNHGETNVDGEITAEVVFSSDHLFNGVGNVKKGIVLGFDDSYVNPDFVVYEMVDVLESKYLIADYDDQLDQTHAIKAMQSGKSLLKKAKVLTAIEKRFLKYESSKAKKLDLSNLNLKQIPESVFGLTDLKELGLSWNRLNEIPQDIRGLKSLEKIDLTNCDFESFPDVLCDVDSLTEINLGRNSISALPSKLATLPNLLKLDINECNFEEFPEVIYELKNLEELNIACQEARPALVINRSMPKLKVLDVSANFRTRIDADFPALENLNYRNCKVTTLSPKLLSCTKLKVLNLDLNRGLYNFPNEIANLKNLQEFAFFIHSQSQNLEIISALPKLRKIYVHFESAEPPDCFWEVLKTAQWTELYFEGEIYNQDFMIAVLKRPNLKKLVNASSQGEYVIDIQDYRRQAGIPI